MKSKMLNRDFIQNMALVVMFLMFGCSDVARAVETEQWDIFELTFKGPSYGNPFVDVELRAEFKHGNEIFRAEGFYDGNGIYKIRFMPNVTGKWMYKTESLLKVKVKFPININDHLF